MTFLILANPTKKECVEYASTLALSLEKTGAGVYTENTPDLLPDYIVVVGGDGTVLRYLDVIIGYDAPVIGVNFGHRGYLTACEPAGAEKLLSDIVKGEAPRLEKRLLLECELISDKGELKKSFMGLNEVFIGRGQLCRALDFSLFINGSSVFAFPADGVIVATPTGSTAYNFSASGPILMPWAKNLVVTPVCASALMRSSLVTASQDTVEIGITTKEDAESPQDAPILVCDGHKRYELEPSDRVRIKCSEKTLSIYCGEKGDFLRVLQKKMTV